MVHHGVGRSIGSVAIGSTWFNVFEVENTTDHCAMHAQRSQIDSYRSIDANPGLIAVQRCTELQGV